MAWRRGRTGVSRIFATVSPCARPKTLIGLTARKSDSTYTRLFFKNHFWACPSLRSGRAAPGFAELRLAALCAARPPLRGARRIPHARAVVRICILAWAGAFSAGPGLPHPTLRLLLSSPPAETIPLATAPPTPSRVRPRQFRPVVLARLQLVQFLAPSRSLRLSQAQTPERGPPGIVLFHNAIKKQGRVARS